VIQTLRTTPRQASPLFALKFAFATWGYGWQATPWHFRLPIFDCRSHVLISADRGGRRGV
jgi:hypothetical protein